MKRFLLALAFLLVPMCASATTTVTGQLNNLGTGTVGSASFVRFYLRGCGGNQPRVSGVAIIAPTSGGIFYFDMVANASGVISGTLYSTRDSTGLLAGDIQCGTSNLSVWYGMQVFVAGKGGPEIPIHAKNGVTLDITSAVPITSTPVVPAPTGDTTYFRLDATNSPVTGNAAFTGTINLPFGTYAARPGSPANGVEYVVTDATAAGVCTAGGGSGLSLCRWNGASWVSLGGSTPANCTSTVGGLVPTPPNDATKFLDGTCNFSVPATVASGALFAKNYGVFADAHIAMDCSWANSSTTATCAAGDVDFTTQAHNGDIVWGVSGVANFFTYGVLRFAQGTISSITDSHNIVVSTTSSGACTSSSTVVCILIWGTHDDTTAWLAADAAMRAAPCTPLIPPVGYSIIQSAMFIAEPTSAQQGLCFDQQQNNYTGPSLIGIGGPSGTVFLPSPTFPSAGCTGGPGGNTCMFSTSGLHLMNISVLGTVSACGAGFSGKNMFEANGGTAAFNNQWQNVYLAGWCTSQAGTTGLVVDHNSGAYLSNVWVTSGNLNCSFGPGGFGGYVTFKDGACAGGGGNPCAVQVAGSSLFGSHNNAYGYCLNNGSIAIDVSNTGDSNFIEDMINNSSTAGTQTGTWLLANVGSGTVNIAHSHLFNAYNSSAAFYLQGSGHGPVNLFDNTIEMTGTTNKIFDGTAGATDKVVDQGGNKLIQTAAGSMVKNQVQGPNVVSSTCTGVVTANTTLFMQSMLGTSGNPNCTNATASVVFVANTTGSIMGLFGTATAAGVNGSSGVVTLLKNGAGTSATCTYGTTTVCNYNAGTSPDTFVPGDIFTLRYTTQLADTLAGLKVDVWLQR